MKHPFGLHRLSSHAHTDRFTHACNASTIACNQIIGTGKKSSKCRGDRKNWAGARMGAAAARPRTHGLNIDEVDRRASQGSLSAAVSPLSAPLGTRQLAHATRAPRTHAGPAGQAGSTPASQRSRRPPLLPPPQRIGAGMAGDLGMKVTEREKMEGAGELATPAAPGTACGCARDAPRLSTGCERGGNGGGRGGLCGRAGGVKGRGGVVRGWRLDRQPAGAAAGGAGGSALPLQI